jgi:hypothetical protein
MPANGMSRAAGGQVSYRGVSRSSGNRYDKSTKKSRLDGRSKTNSAKTVEDEKTALLAKKHQELDDVWNKHDMLVCFLFCPIILCLVSDVNGYAGQRDISYGKLYFDDVLRSRGKSPFKSSFRLAAEWNCQDAKRDQSTVFKDVHVSSPLYLTTQI